MLTGHELTGVFMAKRCRPTTSKLVMRFFFASASFSQRAIGDDTVQLLVGIPQAVSLAYKTRQVASFVVKKMSTMTERSNEESFNELRRRFI